MMLNSLGKKFVSLFGLFLLLTMAFSLFAVPLVSAADVTVFPYLNVQPDPIGVGQRVGVVAFVDKMPSGVAITNSIRFHNYSILVVDPDGMESRLLWDPEGDVDFIVWDTTSSQYTFFTPTKVGTYNLTFFFPEQIVGSGNNRYLAANRSKTLTVQEEPIPAEPSSYPLPTEYWTRPIEAQNTYWYSISSNWFPPSSYK